MADLDSDPIWNRMGLLLFLQWPHLHSWGSRRKFQKDVSWFNESWIDLEMVFREESQNPVIPVIRSGRVLLWNCSDLSTVSMEMIFCLFLQNARPKWYLFLSLLTLLFKGRLFQTSRVLTRSSSYLPYHLRNVEFKDL